uniref:Ammonium transporter AmtB-like domain-containing protein n=1 Tax=Vombatus ursinus TaxID=29139 RepID=A0A4X2KE64_VOMUR
MYKLCIHFINYVYVLLFHWLCPTQSKDGEGRGSHSLVTELDSSLPSRSAYFLHEVIWGLEGGTLFLWVFWPTFNSALLEYPSEKETAVYNTYYALTVSAVVAMSFSAATHSHGKISMTHVHRATLAAGVAVGVATNLIHSPWIAMVLGLLAGMISIAGAKYLLVMVQQVIGIRLDAHGRSILLMFTES